MEIYLREKVAASLSFGAYVLAQQRGLSVN